jgi:inosine/xanthosine triphosphatase
MRIVVASTNQVKIEAARLGFVRLFPDQAWEAVGVAAQSGVSDQPMSDADTLTGALNRSRAAQTARPEADYWVGIEGGCEDTARGLEAFAWVVVRGPGGRLGQARSGTFVLPPAVADLVRQGVELGEADDRVFGRQNSKQANGAIGLLTGDAIDRVALYEHALILALVPFFRPELY